MLKKSFAAAKQLFTAHFPVLMLSVLAELVIRLIVLAPLLFLAVPQTRLLALICPVLFVVLALPARQNYAEALETLRTTGRFPLAHLVSFADYDRKLVQGLKAWPVLLWFLPFAAATGYVIYLATGDIDAFTLIRTLMDMGGGSTVKGVTKAMELYALTLLPGVLGLGFHSALRHRFAQHAPRLNHFRTLGCWLVSLLTLVPFAAVTGIASYSYMQSVVSALSNIGSGIHLPAPDSNLIVIGIAFVVLCMPAIAFRSLLGSAHTACLAEEKKH